jgi:hypothetical protein
LLIFWFSRLVAIERFPLFIDETIHINLSEEGYKTSPLIYAELGRVFTGWWHMAFQAHAVTPAWTARVATLLAVLPGVAATITIGRLIAGTWAGIFIGLLYLFSTYHMFYERLALADPISNSAVLVVVYFAFRLSRRLTYRDAIVVGILLFVAFGAKVSIVPYFGVPIAAALTLRPKGSTWRACLQWMGVALTTTLVLCALFIMGLRLRGYDLLSNSFSYAATSRQQATSEVLASVFSVSRITQNAVNTFTALSTYTGWLVMLICIAAVLYLLFRRQFYLPLCLFGPALAMWVSQPQEIRFWIAFVGLLLLCAGVAIVKLTQHKRLYRYAAITAIVAWAILQWLPFTLTAARNPVDLPLPPIDRAQYIESDASGFGLPEAVAFLSARDPRQIIGMVSNCQGLRYISPEPSLVLCPRINPNGGEISNLTKLLEDNRKSGWFVVLENSPYVPDNAPGELLTVIPRPGNRIQLEIYDLAG